jgi:hypothetical protein
MVNSSEPKPARLYSARLANVARTTRTGVVTTPWVAAVAWLLRARRWYSHGEVFTSTTSGERGAHQSDSCGWGLTV